MKVDEKNWKPKKHQNGPIQPFLGWHWLCAKQKVGKNAKGVKMKVYMLIMIEMLNI